jgi:Conjugal transfer protein TraD
MPRRTIGERMEFAKQRKEKAAQDEAALARMLRAQRDRRIYQLGGLVAKAGLDQLSSAALYGGLLRMAADAGDAATVARWEEAGGQEFHREQVTRASRSRNFPAKYRGNCPPKSGGWHCGGTRGREPDTFSAGRPDRAVDIRAEQRAAT